MNNTVTAKTVFNGKPCNVLGNSSPIRVLASLSISIVAVLCRKKLCIYLGYAPNKCRDYSTWLNFSPQIDDSLLNNEHIHWLRSDYENLAVRHIALPTKMSKKYNNMSKTLIFALTGLASMRFQLDNKQALRMTRKLGTCILPCLGFRFKLLGNRNSQHFFSSKTYWCEAQSWAHQLTEEKTKWWESLEPTKLQLVHSDWTFPNLTCYI